MADLRVCGRCGTVLKGYAAGRLCPTCLLRSGLGDEPEQRAEDGGQRTEGGGQKTEDGAALATGHSSLGRGVVFADYDLLEEIARGGMGVIYKARQRSLNRLVALKMILAGQLASKEQVERFRAEAQAAAHLQHPNIVAIHEVGEAEGQHYFSMDYVEGRNLAELLREGSMVARQAAIYLRTIAEAVHHAHQHGIIHRDLKPSNVLIDGNDQPRITDFGLAKRFVVPPSGGPGTGQPAEAGTTYDLTLSGQVLGSPNYLPPEQAGGKRAEVGPPSDVYSLGAILYHLLTGRPPFQAESLTTLIRQVLETEPVAPRLLNPNVPRDLETICLKCLEKDIPRRYPTAEALTEELGRFLEDQPIQARPVSAPEKVWRWCRRNPRLAGLGAACVLLLLAVAIGSPIAAYRIDRERRRAEAEKLANQRMAYNSDMNLAFQALADKTRGRARELMERYRPATKSETDLRGWEWRYLWKQSAGQSAVTLCERRRSIERLAFTPDSQKLWVGELLGRISLWDLTRKEAILEYPELTYRGGSAFDPSRNRVAQCFSRNGRDFILWVRDAPKADPVFQFETNAIITTPAFSSDGRRLAARIGSDMVGVWNLETRQLITNLPTRTFYGRLDVPPVEFSPRGDLLAVGRFDGTIRLWELASGRVRSVEQNAPEVWALAFSPDGKYLASAGPPLNVFHVWEVATLVRRDLRGSARTYRGFAFDPTRPILAAGAWEEHAIELWNLETGQLTTQFKGQPEMLYCLAFSPDGTILASGGRASGTDKAYVRLWNRQAIQPQPVGGHRTLTNLYSAPVFSADSLRFLAACGPVVRFDAATLQPNEILATYGTNNGAVAISPDGALLVTGDWRGKIHVWDARAHRHLTNLVAGRSAVTRLRFLAQGRLLVARSGEEFGGTWETANWQKKALGKAGDLVLASVSSADASPDGRWLATGHIDGLIRLWNLASGERIKEFAGHTEWVNAVAFSPDGQWLASLSQDDSIILRDLTGGLGPCVLRGHNNPPFDLAFSPDGRRLVVSLGNPDQAVILWDVATSQLLASLRGDGTVYTEPTFSPDGNTLVVVNQNGLAHFWHAPSFAEIEATEKERASLQGSSGPPEAMKR